MLRRHRRRREHIPYAHETLNKGRSLCSGDTRTHIDEYPNGDGRSTKAGAYAPATRHNVNAFRQRVERSTKAGAYAPATREEVMAAIRAEPDAQQRPELMLRRHLQGGGAALRGRSAQQRPELMLRRHKLRTLNTERKHATAQQRPELMLRRHTASTWSARASESRSTKAGAYAPATRFAADCRDGSTTTAQQRPELMLRRHPFAGVCVSRGWWPLNKGRSLCSGDTPKSASTHDQGDHETMGWRFLGPQRPTSHLRGSFGVSGTVGPCGSFPNFHFRTGITGGSHPCQSIHGWPNSCSGPWPRRNVESATFPGKR